MSKVYSAIMVLVVGDALGVPVEFQQRDTFKITDMIGYGTYRQPAGTWSDDSSLTLATMESISRLGKIDLSDIMQNFYKWLHKAEFTPFQNVFDYGMTTYNAILHYVQGEAPENCGGKEIMDNGNGALMRILPLAFIPHSDDDIYKVAGLTHAHEISQRACYLYLLVAKYILEGKDFRMIFEKKDIWKKEYSRVCEIKYLKREDIKSSGYVVDTLEAAFWCLYHTDNYSDCVLKAVNLGDDTDTVAAVAGGLAGLLYSCDSDKGIPDKWISQIPRKEWIKELCNEFENKFKQKNSYKWYNEFLNKFKKI